MCDWFLFAEWRRLLHLPALRSSKSESENEHVCTLCVYEIIYLLYVLRREVYKYVLEDSENCTVGIILRRCINFDWVSSYFINVQQNSFILQLRSISSTPRLMDDQRETINLNAREIWVACLQQFITNELKKWTCHTSYKCSSSPGLHALYYILVSECGKQRPNEHWWMGFVVCVSLFLI